ncbi:integrase, partial [mine drainage metagenome]
TQLAALGIRREVTERCLGHQLREVEGTYVRHDYFKERRAALQQWTALLLEAERGERKVTAIGQRSEQRKAG